MACCEKHDRMDMVLSVDAYNDFPCGTPTNPDGEQRYCCRHCPSKDQEFTPKAVWASNPRLMSHLTEDERHQVLAQAIAAGPLVIDIQVSVPDPAPNSVTPTS
jgi:hypothetical protein